MLASSFPVLDVFLEILYFFLLVLWFFILFQVLMDLFRSPDLHGIHKALWFIFVIIVPFFGVFVYLIARGGKMHQHQVQDAQSQQQAMDDYQSTAHTGTTTLGALLREKIIASAARKFIVIADSTKLVHQLGRFPLPVEVIKMALPVVSRKLDALGLNPKLRHHPDGTKYITDESNYILDCSCGEITNHVKTAADIRGIAGVVEHGLFLGMASIALIASDKGVVKISKLYGDRYNKAISRVAS